MSGALPQLRVAVSIATHNRANDLSITLREIAKLDPQPDEILVHADACTDGTDETVARDFPHVKLLRSEKPVGSVGGRDRILRETGAEIVLSLDDDSHPMETDFIPRLRELHHRHPRAAVLNFPQVTNEFPETMQLDAIDRAAPVLSVASYGGGACSYRREAYLKLPGFVPEFFHTYEEPDYALQCVAGGWQVLTVPSLTIRHRYTPATRSTHRTHSLHCRNEVWSVLLRCPALLVPVMLAFRGFRQLVNAAKLGGLAWLIREPLWWMDALRGSWTMISRRKPVSTTGYGEWLRLSKRPAQI